MQYFPIPSNAHLTRNIVERDRNATHAFHDKCNNKSTLVRFIRRKVDHRINCNCRRVKIKIKRVYNEEESFVLMGFVYMKCHTLCKRELILPRLLASIYFFFRWARLECKLSPFV